MVKGVDNSDHKPARPYTGDKSDEVTTKANETIAAKTKDGVLTMEEIEQLASDIGKIANPRQRAKESQALRNAIRDDPNLTDAERREAVRMLNQAMAKRKPAWSNAQERQRDAAEDAKTTDQTTANEQLINPPAQAAGIEAPQRRTLGARKI